MAIGSIKTLLEKHDLATPRQFEEWIKAWRLAVEGGSLETLLAFVAREKCITKEAILTALECDARVPLSCALTTRMEIEKSLKKFYGVGAETLDEIAKEDEPLELE